MPLAMRGDVNDPFTAVHRAKEAFPVFLLDGFASLKFVFFQLFQPRDFQRDADISRLRF